MQTIEISSERKRVTDLENPSNILRCMQDARTWLPNKVVFTTDLDDLTQDSTCSLFRNMTLCMIDRILGSRNLECAAISPDGIPFQIYRVPPSQKMMIGLLLEIEADHYHQICVETGNGIVNLYCADTGAAIY